MTANKKSSIKLSIIITIFIVISLSGCFSEWHGNATLTIYLGGDADRGTFTPAPEILKQLSYVIELSGPSKSTVGPTEPGVRSVSISLFPGNWDITVTAKNSNGSVYAIGKTTVEARAGQNVSKIVTLMKLEWKIFTDIDEFGEWLKAQPNNNIYNVKLNVNDLVTDVYDTFNGVTIYTSRLSSVLRTFPDKYVNLDLSGSTLTDIMENAFLECFNLTGITIPNSVTIINDYAFQGCLRLASVNIPDGVTSIGKAAFNGAIITSITLPTHPSFTVIDNGTFAFCEKLGSITIPSNVTKIEVEAFVACTSLTSVTFQGTINVDQFDKRAFGEPTDEHPRTYIGDLRDKYLDATRGGIGIYTRQPNSMTWTKQP
jgi:hypothetical protein